MGTPELMEAEAQRHSEGAASKTNATSHGVAACFRAATGSGAAATSKNAARRHKPRGVRKTWAFRRLWAHRRSTDTAPTAEAATPPQEGTGA